MGASSTGGLDQALDFRDEECATLVVQPVDLVFEDIQTPVVRASRRRVVVFFHVGLRESDGQ